MACHICGKEAVDRCYTCGNLVCELHGGVNCTRCETAIAAGDNRRDRVSASPLRQQNSRTPWWRPQQAEDVPIPACHVCQGLARLVCRNCEQYYCREHAGLNGMCKECGRTSLVGLIIFLVALVAMAFFMIWGALADT